MHFYVASCEHKRVMEHNGHFISPTVSRSFSNTISSAGSCLARRNSHTGLHELNCVRCIHQAGLKSAVTSLSKACNLIIQRSK